MTIEPATIEPATLEDAADIWQLQQLAYQTEAATYDNYSIPPLLETLEELRSQFAAKRFLKALSDGRIIGSVRGVQREATCFVERLIVHPDYRRRGIGMALLQQLEAAHPDAGRFELFTGQRSATNIRLYERVGYRAFRHELINEKLTMVFLQKNAGLA
jgi:GNAT superfamily N-acetyltransferase